MSCRTWCRRTAAMLLAIAAAPGWGAPDKSPLPVIDMHVHASHADYPKPLAVCPGNETLVYPPLEAGKDLPESPLMECAHPILSSTTTKELEEGTIRELRKNNVRHAVLAGRPELVADWMAKAPGLFIPAASPTGLSSDNEKILTSLHKQGRAALFAEIGLQYVGIRADDPRIDDFWALAEKLDVPVGIHLGEGVPGGAAAAGSKYRASLTSPFQLEEVLSRHPHLRLYVMHAASPLTDEMIAMLYTHASLYVDVAANDWGMPRAQFYKQLERLVDAGFSKRIMFGSDQTLWPQAIGLGIRTIEEAPFLTSEQKRDILYNNAARFLRLSAAEIAKDHGR